MTTENEVFIKKLADFLSAYFTDETYSDAVNALVAMYYYSNGHKENIDNSFMIPCEQMIIMDDKKDIADQIIKKADLFTHDPDDSYLFITNAYFAIKNNQTL